MATSQRSGLKPAVLFGWQRSGNLDVAPPKPPRSPTLCPRSSPLHIGEIKAVDSLANTLAPRPTHGGERLRRPCPGSAAGDGERQGVSSATVHHRVGWNCRGRARLGHLESQRQSSSQVSKPLPLNRGWSHGPERNCCRCVCCAWCV